MIAHINSGVFYFLVLALLVMSWAVLVAYSERDGE